MKNFERSGHFPNKIIARPQDCEVLTAGRSPFGNCKQSPVGQKGSDRTTGDPVGLFGSRLKNGAFPHLMRDRVEVRGPASSAGRRVPLKGPASSAGKCEWPISAAPTVVAP